MFATTLFKETPCPDPSCARGLVCHFSHDAEKNISYLQRVLVDLLDDGTRHPRIEEEEEEAKDGYIHSEFQLSERERKRVRFEEPDYYYGQVEEEEYLHLGDDAGYEPLEDYGVDNEEEYQYNDRDDSSRDEPYIPEFLPLNIRPLRASTTSSASSSTSSSTSAPSEPPSSTSAVSKLIKQMLPPLPPGATVDSASSNSRPAGTTDQLVKRKSAASVPAAQTKEKETEKENAPKAVAGDAKFIIGMKAGAPFKVAVTATAPKAAGASKNTTTTPSSASLLSASTSTSTAPSAASATTTTTAKKAKTTKPPTTTTTAATTTAIAKQTAKQATSKQSNAGVTTQATTTSASTITKNHSPPKISLSTKTSTTSTLTKTTTSSSFAIKPAPPSAATPSKNVLPHQPPPVAKKKTPSLFALGTGIGQSTKNNNVPGAVVGDKTFIDGQLTSVEYPTIKFELRPKVPRQVRQAFLDKLLGLYLAKYPKNKQKAIDDAIKVEEEIITLSATKNIYVNLFATKVKKLFPDATT